MRKEIVMVEEQSNSLGRARGNITRSNSEKVSWKDGAHTKEALEGRKKGKEWDLEETRRLAGSRRCQAGKKQQEKKERGPSASLWGSDKEGNKSVWIDRPVHPERMRLDFH